MNEIENVVTNSSPSSFIFSIKKIIFRLTMINFVQEKLLLKLKTSKKILRNKDLLNFVCNTIKFHNCHRISMKKHNIPRQL